MVPAAISIVVVIFAIGLVPIVCGLVAVRMRATRRHDDGDDEQGGDDGGRPRTPLPDPPATGPDGVDWDSFDRARSEWEVARGREQGV